MIKRTLLGVIAGICLTEITHYYGFHAEPLFYVYIAFGAMTAAYISGHTCSGLVISGYVLLWKVGSLVFLMRAYGSREVGSSFLLFLLDWILVILTGVAGGYIGTFFRAYVDRKRNSAARVG